MGIPDGPVSGEELLETPEHNIGVLRDLRVLEEDEDCYCDWNQTREQALIGRACAGRLHPAALSPAASAKDARSGRESGDSECEKAGRLIR